MGGVRLLTSSLWGSVRDLLTHVSGPTSRQSFIALMDQAVVSGASFAVTVLMGRAGSEAELGLYTLGLTTIFLVGAAQDSLVLVPYTFFLRREPTERAAEYAGTALGQSAVMWVMGVILLALAAALFSGGGPLGFSAMLAALAVLSPLVLLREFVRRFAYAHVRAGAALRIDVFVVGLQLALLVGLAATGRLTAVTGFVALGIASAAAGGGWLAANRDRFAVRWKSVTGEWSRHWSFSRWIFATQISHVVHGYVVFWILAFIWGAGSTGVFAACMTVVMISNPLVLAINNVLMPRTAGAVAGGGTKELWRVVRKTTLLFGAVMLPITVVLVLAGGPIVAWIFGPDYGDLGGVVAVLALAALAWASDVTPLNGVRAMDRPDLNLRASLIGLVVTIAAATPLAAGYGVFGAAVGVLMGAVVESSLQWIGFLRLVRADGGVNSEHAGPEGS